MALLYRCLPELKLLEVNLCRSCQQDFIGQTNKQNIDLKWVQMLALEKVGELRLLDCSAKVVYSNTLEASNMCQINA